MNIDSTQQFKSEQDIFDYNQIEIQLPSSYSIYTSPNKKNRNNNNVNNKYQKTMKDGLNSTSKIPLNIGIVDNTLFISTLTREKLLVTTTKKPMTYCWENEYNSNTPIYYPKSQQSETQMIINSSSSSCSSMSSYTSIQSDNITLSTELIRRFSSESTTSTVATSISASSILVDAQTTEDKMNLINYKEKEISQEANNIILNQQQQQQQQLGHDPGHACNTMHSPYKLQHNEAYNSNQSDTLPAWVDPKKLKENSTKFIKVKNYIKENQIPTELPLLKSCVFYFSDTNNIKQQCYMSAVNSVFQCDTVWQFSARWRIYKNSYSKTPSKLLPNQNLFCFIKGVEPMWEDKVNEKGGRLNISIINQNLLDDLFERLLLSFIGGNLFDYGVVGIVLSRRNRGDRIELWLDQSNSTNQTISLTKEYLCHLLPNNCHNEINASRYKKHF